MATMKQLMEEFQGKFDLAMANHEKLVADSVARYEATLSNATEQFQQMLHKSAEENKVPREKPVDEVPQAVWIADPSDPDGQLMVINKAAVIFLLAILNRVGEVADELKKTSIK